jgi:KDO2-lipid IV(A) lauroyltransferase
MQRLLLRCRAVLRNILKPPAEALIGALAVLALRTARRFDPDRMADLFARIARRFGPYLREDKIGRDNLKAAFPEKSDDEIERILGGVWDNLGRVTAEYAQLDRIWQIDFDNSANGRIAFDPRSLEIFEKLRDDGKPALFFSAHLANWELPAVASAEYGLDSVILFRPPGVPAVNRAVQDIRAVKMGEMVPAQRDAPLRLAHALNDGRHVGMLVDQFHAGGVLVDFFGRPARTNPMLARLLRQVDCPIHGTRMIRLPDHRFRAEISEAISPVRSAKGDIDIQGTMQAITKVIEGWIREHPEQWLWLHRRWRNY